MKIYGISPGDELEYKVQWRGTAPGPWLAASESIASMTTEVAGPISVMSSATVGDDVVVWVTPTAAARAGHRAELRVRIVTNNTPPRKKSAVMQFIIED